LTAAGGDVLAQISGTVVAAFDASEATDIIENALELLDAAEQERMAIAIGIALGPIEEGAGRAVENAELLATRAQAGELVCDPAARERLEGLFLFGRQISTGVGGPRGTAIDRVHPRREGLNDAIGRLGPLPVAPVARELEGKLVTLMQRDEPSIVILRGPVGAGAVELVSAAATKAAFAVVIGLSGAPGGIIPLASLRYGLLRAVGGENEIALACGSDETGKASVSVLSSLLHGGLPARSELANALTHLFVQLGRGRRCLVFLAPLTRIDGATLEVLLDVREQSGAVVIVARSSVEAELPITFAELAEELTLPPLRTSDARAIAEAVLGPETDPEVARRVAVLGGETPLGVVEVARALISAGDLVPEGDGFVWRGQPRAGATAIPLEEVVLERLDQLDDETRRMIEAVCVAPDGAHADLISAIAERDGLTEKARQRAMERLRREAWLAAPNAWPTVFAREAEPQLSRPAPSTNFVRRMVISAMPSARLGQLHRFAAEALFERGADDLVLGSMQAELGFFEAEGGLAARGIEHLNGVAELAKARGFKRAAARMNRYVKRLDRATSSVMPQTTRTPWEDESSPPSAEISLDEVRKYDGLGVLTTGEDVSDTLTGDVASVVMNETLLGETSSPSIDNDVALNDGAADPPDHGSSFVVLAENAVRNRDMVALDRLLERAIASGSDLAAIARIRAMSDLLRGDVGKAKQGLAQARRYKKKSVHSDPREAIAEAAVALGGGDLASAVRLGLRALAITRRAADRKGELAALRTLAACYRALGRFHDATLIEQAAL
jgi:hypothetical protein